MEEEIIVDAFWMLGEEMKKAEISKPNENNN